MHTLASQRKVTYKCRPEPWGVGEEGSKQRRRDHVMRVLRWVKRVALGDRKTAVGGVTEPQ